jgi:anaerobic ribonucleoside-triphosphate reductase activating protein
LDTWAFGRGVTTVENVLASIRAWLEQADGITISGGEPFDQPEALRELLVGIRQVSRGDILVFSGYALEELRGWLNKMDGLIDALVADPFQLEASQTRALRGSDNQRLVPLTLLGIEQFRAYERPTTQSDQTLDVMFDESTGEVWLAGIPRRGDLRRLANLLAASGHTITTSDSRHLPMEGEAKSRSNGGEGGPDE